MRTKPWFRLHSFAGVVTGMFLFVVCWSGTFATVSHEIDWLLTPSLRADDALHIDIDAVERAALRRHPGAELQWIAWPLHRHYAFDVVLKTPSASMWHEYVAVQPPTARGGITYFNVQRFFRSLHMSLFLAFGVGIYVVGAAGVLLLLSAFTPMVFFKRWWSRWLQFRAGGGARAVTSESHKLVGLWSLWFVALIAVTGTWYPVEQLMIDVADVDFVYPSPPPFDGDAQPRLPLSRFLAAARAARPELEPRAIGVGGNGLVYVNGQAGDLLVRDRANTLFFKPTTAALVEDRRASDLGLLRRWIEAVDLLHFGTFAGLPTKLVWFAFGLLLCALCMTGAYLHACRLAAGNGAQARWPGLGAALLVTAALLCWSAAGGYAEALRFGPATDGIRRLPSVPGPVLAFLCSWVAVTLGLLALWAGLVLRAPVSVRRAGANGPQRRTPARPTTARR